MKQLIYKTRPGYDSRNRCSFNRFLKVSRDGAEVTSADRSFHVRAPATGKVRCPIVRGCRQTPVMLCLGHYCAAATAA